ncbi:MAG: hypothetical protein HYZ50_20270 [Deltaproteobacteria bacterium]|nr:hypothetical protein [Deltaproteobacteria bacterium]
MNTTQQLNGADVTVTTEPSTLSKVGGALSTIGGYVKEGAFYTGMVLGAALLWGASYLYNTYAESDDTSANSLPTTKK